MNITKVPSGEYYLQNGRGKGFYFFVKHSHKSESDKGNICLSNNTIVPKELIGKKIMLKVEVVKYGGKDES